MGRLSYTDDRHDLVHISKFRNGTGKILANASTPDFSGASDIILGYALRIFLSLAARLGSDAGNYKKIPHASVIG
jgi:hypothetical protein